MTDTPTPWWARQSATAPLPPAAVRRWTARRVIGPAATLIVIAAALLGILVGVTPEDPQRITPFEVAYRQSSIALLGGCGQRFVFSDTERNSGIVDSTRSNGAPNFQNYATLVPVQGRFWDSPVATEQRFYSATDPQAPRPEALLNSMWAGWMVVYYTPQVPASDLAALKALVDTRPDLKMIVAPWRRGFGPLPANRSLAFAVWGSSQSCHTFKAGALGDFRRSSPPQSAPGAQGKTPPRLS